MWITIHRHGDLFDFLWLIKHTIRIHATGMYPCGGLGGQGTIREDPSHSNSLSIFDFAMLPPSSDPDVFDYPCVPAPRRYLGGSIYWLQRVLCGVWSAHGTSLHLLSKIPG
jgi:hypothetical protein